MLFSTVICFYPTSYHQMFHTILICFNPLSSTFHFHCHPLFILINYHPFFITHLLSLSLTSIFVITFLCYYYNFNSLLSSISSNAYKLFPLINILFNHVQSDFFFNAYSTGSHFNPDKMDHGSPDDENRVCACSIQ